MISKLLQSACLLTIPFLGASGSSVHFAGMHFGTLLQVPLLQLVVRLVVGWNCDRHRTDIDWLWPAASKIILNQHLYPFYQWTTRWPCLLQSRGRCEESHTELKHLKILWTFIQSLTVAPLYRMTPSSICLAYGPVWGARECHPFLTPDTTRIWNHSSYFLPPKSDNSI